LAFLIAAFFFIFSMFQANCSAMVILARSGSSSALALGFATSVGAVYAGFWAAGAGPRPRPRPAV
jgi:hypothetical protein